MGSISSCKGLPPEKKTFQGREIEKKRETSHNVPERGKVSVEEEERTAAEVPTLQPT